MFFNSLFWIAFAGAVLFFYSNRQTSRYVVRHENVWIKKPLSAPQSLSILHLSDIHFHNQHPRLNRFFDRLADAVYDFVFVTGDIIESPGGIRHCIENFKKLKPRYGIFAVLGNHDYYDYTFADVIFHSAEGGSMPRLPNQFERLERSLKEIGVRILKNETAEVEVGKSSILIHGIDDPVSGHSNVRRAMENFRPEKVNILLTHTIDAFLDIGEDEMDLSFSGHLHGGQVCLPIVGPIIVPTIFGRRYAGGLRHLKGTACSISRGLGTSRYYPFRLLCPPEAIVLKVHGIS